MQKFICEQNIAHFQKLLNETTDSGRRRTLEALLLSARRDLSLLESKLSGAEASPLEARLRRHGDAKAVLEQFKPEFEASAHPYMLIDPAPGLRIVDINEAYARATLTRRDDVVGQSLFDIFPDNPDDSLADGVINLFT
jgi:PAS domain-containing protein